MANLVRVSVLISISRIPPRRPQSHAGPYMDSTVSPPCRLPMQVDHTRWGSRFLRLESVNPIGNCSLRRPGVLLLAWCPCRARSSRTQGKNLKASIFSKPQILRFFSACRTWVVCPSDSWRSVSSLEAMLPAPRCGQSVSKALWVLQSRRLGRGGRLQQRQKRRRAAKSVVVHREAVYFLMEPTISFLVFFIQFFFSQF